MAALSWCLALSLVLVIGLCGVPTIDAGDSAVPESQASSGGVLCGLCEQYSVDILKYLKQNETECEVLQALYHVCSKLGPIRQQCLSLVDQYVPDLFATISTLTPDELCETAHLCKQTVSLGLNADDDLCAICHYVVSETLTKLEDADTQLEVLEILLKACNAIKNHEQQCKRLVFEYAPLILANAEKFLENRDVCHILLDCDASMHVMAKAASLAAA